MGDHCNIQITLRREDLARFAKHVDAQPDDKWWDELHDDPGNGVVTVEMYDVNYGLCDARASAAADGIPFYGNHSEGSAYSPCGFVSWQGVHYETVLDHSNELVVAVDQNMKPSEEALRRLREYVTAFKAVRNAFEKNPQSDSIKEAA